MTATAERLTPNQQYRKLERMLHQLVHKYRRMLPMEDYDDLLSEAHVAYCIALNEFDPAKGKITTWVYWKVRGQLTHLARQRLRQSKRLTQHQIDRDFQVPDDPVRVAAAMDGDAGTAVRLALQGPGLNPEELADELAKLNWSGERIVRTFADMRKALR